MPACVSRLRIGLDVLRLVAGSVGWTGSGEPDDRPGVPPAHAGGHARTARARPWPAAARGRSSPGHTGDGCCRSRPWPGVAGRSPLGNSDSCSRSVRLDATTPSSRTSMPRISGRASASGDPEDLVDLVGRRRQACAGGCGSTKWESRILTPTVAALTPPSRRRLPTPSASASRVRSMISGSRVSRSKVCSWLTAARRPRHRPPGWGRCPGRARRASCRARRTGARSTSGGRHGQVTDGLDAVVGERPSRLLADAPQPPDRQWRQERRLGALRARRPAPSGLRRSDAILATSRVDATPTEAVRPSSRPDGRPDVGRDALRGTLQGEGARRHPGTPRRWRSAPPAASSAAGCP